jgi:hypothetical protein
MRTLIIGGAFLAATSLAAIADGPSPYTCLPQDTHAGENSFVVLCDQANPLGTKYIGVKIGNVGQIEVIMSAYNAKRAFGYGTVVPAATQISCDPHFCPPGQPAYQVSNLTGSISAP